MTVIDLGTKRREQTLNNMEMRQTKNTLYNRGTEHDTTLSEQYTQNLGVLESPDFFEPIETPLFATYEGQSVEVPNRKAIIRSDTGEVVSTVGHNYKVVNNATVFAAFDQALAESEIDLTGAYKRVSVASGGAKTILAYSFPAYEETITNRETGDVIRLTALLLNSYDASSMFSARFQEDRLICKNSMVGATDITTFAGRHTQNLQIEHAAEKIKQSIDVFCGKADLYKRWANDKISLDTAIKCFEKLSVKKSFTTEVNEKRLEEYLEQWNVEVRALGHTKWALYNTLTHISTHAKVQERSLKAGNAPLRQLNREIELTKFLQGPGREFLDFGEAA